MTGRSPLTPNVLNVLIARSSSSFSAPFILVSSNKNQYVRYLKASGSVLYVDVIQIQRDDKDVEGSQFANRPKINFGPSSSKQLQVRQICRFTNHKNFQKQRSKTQRNKFIQG